MTRRIKVLTIYYKHKRGGFCKRIRMQIEAYLEAGWEVHYIALIPFPYTHKYLKPHLLPCPLKRHSGIPFWIYFFLIAPLYTLFIGFRHRFSLISSVSPVYAWIARPLARLRGTPMVTYLLTRPRFTSSSRTHYRGLERLEEAMESAGLRASNMILANSEAGRRAWIEAGGPALERIRVHSNNVESRTFDRAARRRELIARHGLREDSFVIASAGLFEPHKNFGLLITAFARIGNRRAVLILYGGGELQRSLEKTAARLGISDRVIFPGWDDKAGVELQGVDLFVFPSLREGMSEALLEAGSCQIPCLVSAIPENVEVIQDASQHFPPDSMEELHRLLERCMNDEVFYRRIRSQTIADIQRFVFDWKQTLVRTLREALL